MYCWYLFVPNQKFGGRRRGERSREHWQTGTVYQTWQSQGTTSPQRTCPDMPGTWGTDYFTTENLPRCARYMGYRLLYHREHAQICQVHGVHWSRAQLYCTSSLYTYTKQLVKILKTTIFLNTFEVRIKLLKVLSWDVLKRIRIQFSNIRIRNWLNFFRIPQPCNVLFADAVVK